MKMRERMFADRNLALANNWVGKAEAYRQASFIAQRYGQEELHSYLRERMRFWSLSVAEQLKKRP